MTVSEVADWLALVSAPGLGPRTVSRLIARFGHPAAVRAAQTQALLDLGLKARSVDALRSPDQARIERTLAWADQPAAHVITLDDPRYPPLLAEIPDAPPVLFVRGDPDLLRDPQIAIVGSRNPSRTGAQVSRELAAELAGCGLTITSGLAMGVDGAAHAGALERGRTLAVLGTGPDRVYPGGHVELARRIADQGALLSELPPGVGPLARHFPRRNRIISGLSLGTLVTEATLGSGSLITARLAMEQGREVFAVPGSIRNPLSRGCHALIRDGARLVETAQDVLVELGPRLRGILAEPIVRPVVPTVDPHAAGLEPEYQALLDAMGFDPVAPDELVRLTGTPVEELSSMLLLLELEGHVSSCAGGRYSRLR